MEYIIEAINTQKERYDLSEVVIDLTWRTELYEQVGELSFTYVDQKDLNITEGTAIMFKIRDKEHGEKIIFNGIIVNRKWSSINGKNALSNIHITCYDLLWHLRGKYTGKISQSNPMKPYELFNDVCKRTLKDSNLYRVTDEAKKVNIQLTSEIKDTEPGGDVLTKMCKQTLIRSDGKDWLYYYDEGGRIVLDRIKTLDQNAKSIEDDGNFKDMIIFGDASGIVSFNLNSSINNGAYNRVFLYTEGKNKERQEVIKKNEASIKLFGEIPYVEKVDSNLSKAQLEKLAENKLQLFSRPTMSIELECIGNLFSMNSILRAGSVVSIDLEYLKVKEKVSNNQLFLVSQITHNFNYKNHMMSIKIDSFKSDSLAIGQI